MFIRSLVLASIVSLAASTCVRDYTVKEGDFCDKISAAQGVSTYQLAVVNNGIINDDCTNLMPDQKICLGYKGSDCTTVYTVVMGDICEDIAAAHKINTTLLYENNRQINPECTNIYVGEVLCVDSIVNAPPPPAGGKPIPIPSTAVPANPTKTPEANNKTEDNEDDLPWCDEL